MEGLDRLYLWRAPGLNWYVSQEKAVIWGQLKLKQEPQCLGGTWPGWYSVCLECRVHGGSINYSALSYSEVTLVKP